MQFTIITFFVSLEKKMAGMALFLDLIDIMFVLIGP